MLPLAFQRATLKSWEWPGDEATCNVQCMYICHITYTSKLQVVSIFTRILMKGQGSLELAMEIQEKQRRLTIDDFYKSDSHLLDSCYE